MSSSYENILYEVVDGVATITMNRGEKLNPITHGPGEMHNEILDAIECSDRDDDVRCIILTGAGRAFSSGGSPGEIEMPETAAGWVEFHRHNNSLNDRIRAQSKPVIGAINGLCYGGGMVVAYHLDLLVASDRARFGLIETRFGAPGVDVLAMLVGPQWAKFLAISGELIDAHKAKEIGLVLEVIPHERFAERVQDLGRRIASMPAETVMLNRRLINGAMEIMGWTQQKQLAIALNAISNSVMDRAATPDGRVLSEILSEEGWKAFKDARDKPFEKPWLEASE